MADEVTGKRYKVGSRKSELAMLQTKFVVGKLQSMYPQHTFEIVGMSTIGDLILDVALAKVGEKSMFTKELELGILNGEVDFVVHSLKDLPTVLPQGLTIAAILEREDPRDVVVLPKGQTFDSTLPVTFSEKTVFGTSSARRTAAIRLKYPKSRIVDVRGNIQTRLKKLDDPSTPYTALILAAAGLHRLGLESRISRYLTKEEFDWPYAVGQGALGVECLDGNLDVKNLLAQLTHPETYFSCLAERALLMSFGGGCSVPLGVRSFFTNYVKGAGNPNTFTIEGYYYADYKVLRFTKTMELDSFPGEKDPSSMTGITILQFPDFQQWTCYAMAGLGAECGRQFIGEVGKCGRKVSSEQLTSDSMVPAEVSVSLVSVTSKDRDSETKGSFQ